MNNNEQREINFFESKINVDPNADFNILKKKLISNSIKIYIVVFIAVIGYFGINNIITNIRYKSIEKNLSKMQEENTASKQIKDALLIKQNLINFLDEFNKSKKFYTNTIKYIEKIKPREVTITEMILDQENINIKCSGIDPINAIKYINELRKNEMFLDVLYAGGDFSSVDNTFTFEINIKN